MKSIDIAVMVKNSSRYLDSFWNVIKSFSYPKDKIRVFFIYGSSSDSTLEKLKKIARDKDIAVEVYREPGDPDLKKYGQFMGASIWYDFKDLCEGDYLLTMDVHIEKAPRDLIEKLVSYNEDVIAPYPYIAGKNLFYDSWTVSYTHLTLPTICSV